MPDQDWQHAVLRELGVSQLGLATPEVPRPVLHPIPVHPTGPSPAPTGQGEGRHARSAPPTIVEPMPVQDFERPAAPLAQPVQPVPPVEPVQPVQPVQAAQPSTPTPPPPPPGPMGVPPQTRRPAPAEQDPAAAVRPETVIFSMPARPAAAEDPSSPPVLDPSAVIRPQTFMFAAPDQTASASVVPPAAAEPEVAPPAPGERTGAWYSEPVYSRQDQTPEPIPADPSDLSGPAGQAAPRQADSPVPPVHQHQYGQPDASAQMQPATPPPHPQDQQVFPPQGMRPAEQHQAAEPPPPSPVQPPVVAQPASFGVTPADTVAPPDQPRLPEPHAAHAADDRESSAAGSPRGATGPLPVPPVSGPVSGPAQFPPNPASAPAPAPPSMPSPAPSLSPFTPAEPQPPVAPVPHVPPVPPQPEPSVPPLSEHWLRPVAGPAGHDVPPEAPTAEPVEPLGREPQPPSPFSTGGDAPQAAIPAYGFTQVFNQMQLQEHARAEAEATARREATPQPGTESPHRSADSWPPAYPGTAGTAAGQGMPPAQQQPFGPGPAGQYQGQAPVPIPIPDPATAQGHQQAQQQAAPEMYGQPPAPPVASQPPAQPQPQPPAEELARKNRHGDPMLRRMSRGVRKVMGASAAQDARLLAEVVDKLQSPVPTCRQIAVTSVRGGAGKTTVAALTAGMTAKYRQDRVLTIDADTGLGSLPLRLGARAQLSLHDLISARPGNWQDATRFLAQTSEGVWLLSGTTGGQLAEELEVEQFQTAFAGIGRYFSTAVIDCGAGIVNRLQRGILAGSHGQILVTPATVDGAVSAMGAIDWYNANGYAGLLHSTVITLVTHTPHKDADLDKAVEMLSSGGLPVIHIPYDRHLATGTAIDMSRISEAARTAATRIAAEVFARSVGR